MKKLLYILLFVPIALFGQENDPCYSVNEFMTQTEGENPSIIKNFVGGWNMFGYPCSQSVDLSNAFNSIVEKVIIVKDNSGNVYMPEFGFNGIGFLDGGEGYQIKMTNTEYGFSFCEHISWPNIEGCTDCEASNFNQWANIDDGSCNYDSDGDGIIDSLEIIGCQDSLACNYDETATDAGLCTYVEPYFNCDGTPQIGASYQGGIVFYLDETGQHGLVAAIEDIGNYEWGCVDVMVDGADEQAVGYGLQNTNDIVAVCADTTIAAIAALAYESNGFNDWFLPSFDELYLMKTNISESSQIGNIGQFNNWWNWSSSEMDETTAFASTFVGEGCYMCENYKGAEGAVRPIRAFGNWTMGCMDVTACNFYPEANMADGSCEFPEQGYDCEGNITEYVVGMEAEGGIVFYVDETGQHGLVAATEDLEGTYEWGCYGTDVNGANETAIGSGYQNTLDIVAGCSYTPIAASEALAYESGGFDDWYLPSRYELLEMYNTIGNGGPQGNIGVFQNSYYWSSSKGTNYNAWFVGFDNGYTTTISKGNASRVRVIRAF